MKISSPLTDQAILSEIGNRLVRRRIDLQLTQADVAQQAGVAKRTLERIEAGAPAQTSSLIRIFRVLDLLQGLENITPESKPGPMELLKHRGKTRHRVSRSRRATTSATPGGSWTWEK